MSSVLKYFLQSFAFCVLLFITFTNYSSSLPLILIVTTAILWKSYDHGSPIKVKFNKLHNYPSLASQTAAMLLQEWPSPVGNHGNPEVNFVRTSSLYESSDELPCHLIATVETADGQTEVVAHAMIASTSNYQAQDCKKYINMLQKGVPLSSVKMSAEFAGIDSSFLDDPEMKHVRLEKDSVVHEVCLSSLLVGPDYRKQGLGRGMCAFALKVSKALGIKRITGGCVDRLVPFYEKMGASRMEGRKRRDMPSVRLGNEMYLNLTSDSIQKAEQLLTKFN